MKEYTISKNDSGQRLNKFLEKSIPSLPAGLMHKYLRLKRIKVNGKRSEAAYRLCEGDLVQLFISDAFFAHTPKDPAYKKIKAANIAIVYEDEHILLVDKAPGMVVHGGEHGEADTLIAHIQAYLHQSGAWNPADALSFAPALCNRIDRNTGGLVIAAKTAEALRIINDKIGHHELDKRYLCVVRGMPAGRTQELTHFIRRDKKHKLVEVFEESVPNAKLARMTYEVLTTQGGFSLLACTLLTGRTHQIRAQMAHIGFPLVGDGKYSENRKRHDGYGQLLYAYQLRFDFRTDAGALSYLKGKTFTVPSVPFVQRYFPRYQISSARGNQRA